MDRVKCSRIGQFLRTRKMWSFRKFSILLRVKVSKSIIFIVKPFLGNFYRHLAIFYWSHCPHKRFWEDVFGHTCQTNFSSFHFNDRFHSGKWPYLQFHLIWRFSHFERTFEFRRLRRVHQAASQQLWLRPSTAQLRPQCRRILRHFDASQHGHHTAFQG